MAGVWRSKIACASPGTFCCFQSCLCSSTDFRRIHMGNETTPLASIHKPLASVTRFLSSLKGSKRHIGIASKQLDGDAPPKPLPTLATGHAEVHLTLATQSAVATTVSRRKQTSPPKGRHLYVAASKPIQKGETANLFATPSEQDAPRRLKADPQASSNRSLTRRQRWRQAGHFRTNGRRMCRTGQYGRQRSRFGVRMTPTR